MSLLLFYIFVGSGVIITPLGLTWFTYEMNFEHQLSGVDYRYRDHYGLGFRYDYDLDGITVKHYDSDLDPYWQSEHPYEIWADGDKMEYEEAANFTSTFENQALVASSTKNLVLISCFIWIIPSAVGFFFIYRTLSLLEPRLGESKKQYKIQNQVSFLSKKIMRIRAKEVNTSSLDSYIALIKDSDSSRVKVDVPKSPSKILNYMILAVTISSLIFVAAVVLYQHNWPLAMSNEEACYGPCSDVSAGGSSGSHLRTSSAFYFTYTWSLAPIINIFMFGSIIASLGTVRNCLFLRNSSLSMFEEIVDINKKSADFEMPDFDEFSDVLEEEKEVKK
jgi:hypothetical protein